MRRRYEWPAWAGFVAGCGLCMLGLTSAHAGSSDTGPRGAAVFQKNCASCHGEASGAPVVRLPRPFEFDTDLVRATVRDGRGEMPAFSTGQISDADIDAVADFLRSGEPR